MPKNTKKLPEKLVIDTNIILDVFLFKDEKYQELSNIIQSIQNNKENPVQQYQWLATIPMREELGCVLHYQNIQKKLQQASCNAAKILIQFDAATTLVQVAPSTQYICRDKDDQKFIDLAIQHHAILYSKDKAVLKLRKPLARIGITVTKYINTAL